MRKLKIFGVIFLFTIFPIMLGLVFYFSSESLFDFFMGYIMLVFIFPVLLLIHIFVYRVKQFLNYLNERRGKFYEVKQKTYHVSTKGRYQSNRFKNFEVLTNRLEFERWLFNVKMPMGSLAVVKPEMSSRGERRPIGAIAYLDAQTVSNNEEFMRLNPVNRNQEKRSSSDVPGFAEVSKKPQFVDNQPVYLWHRTHLIPFKHSRSEGDDIPALLFTGTAHLNSGNRPHLGYEVKSGRRGVHSREKRKEYLLNNFLISRPIISLEEADAVYLEGQSIYERFYSDLKNPKSINVPKTPKDSHYSLREVEEAMDLRINRSSSRRYEYAYGVMCHYKNEHEVIPESVSAFLINHTKGELEFYIHLPNTI